MGDCLAVIGHPIGHSLSPLLHNAMAGILGVDAQYSAVDVTVENLPQWVDTVRKQGILGFNATMPHKEYLIPLVDSQTQEAEFFGAINTVANRQGHLVGHNTDGDGFAAMLAEHGLTFQGTKVTILGAGGSAGAIFKKAMAMGAQSVTVMNRTVSRAENLCQAYESGFARNILDEIPSDTQLLISTIPVGAGIDPARLDGLSKDCAVVDILYAPPKTELLLAAEQRGMMAINGLGMLVHQAILAFGFFYNMEINAMDMAKKLYIELEKRV